MSTPDQTNAATATHATEEDALRLTRVHLIGIAGAEGARRAILRRRSGTVEVVHVGDDTPLGEVVAIDKARVIFAGKAGIRSLQMPGPDASAA